MIDLASQSPRRAAILREANISFRCIQNQLTDEFSLWNNSAPPNINAVRIAEQKALLSAQPDSRWVLGSDTVVHINQTLFPKPKSLAQAAEYLRQLSDCMHTITTSYALFNKSDQMMLSGTDCATLTFRRLTDAQTTDYITHHDVLDKAGAYGIQNIPSDWVATQDGHTETIMGLPIQVLYPIFQKHGIIYRC